MKFDDFVKEKLIRIIKVLVIPATLVIIVTIYEYKISGRTEHLQQERTNIQRLPVATELVDSYYKTVNDILPKNPSYRDNTKSNYISRLLSAKTQELFIQINKIALKDAANTTLYNNEIVSVIQFLITSNQSDIFSKEVGFDFSVLSLHKVNFEKMEMNDFFFDRAKLNEATFKHTSLTNTTFRLSDLQKATFLGVNLMKTQFVEVNLDRAIFRDEAYIHNLLRETVFAGSTLKMTDFGNTTLMNVVFNCVDLSNAEFSNAEFSNIKGVVQKIKFEDVILRGANFNNVIFKDEIDFSTSYLMNANFVSTDLKSIKFSDHLFLLEGARFGTGKRRAKNIPPEIRRRIDSDGVFHSPDSKKNGDIEDLKIERRFDKTGVFHFPDSKKKFE